MRKSIVVSAIVATAIVAAFVARVDGRESTGVRRENPVVPAPHLVETLGTDRPSGDYETTILLVGALTPRAEDTGGWAGTIPENGRVKVYWKGGTISTEYRDIVTRFATPVPVEIYTTRFSMMELRKAQEEVFPLLSKKGICGSGVPEGADAIEIYTWGDSAPSDIPQETFGGIPIVVEKGPCGTPM